jgi:hypothetical protein
MERRYRVKKIEISSRNAKGEHKSLTPNYTDMSYYTWEGLNGLAHTIISRLTKKYTKAFFNKLVVTVTYNIIGDNAEYAIDCGFDEEGEVYCS